MRLVRKNNELHRKVTSIVYVWVGISNVYSLYVGHTICGGGSGPAAPGGGGTGGSGGESIPTIEVKQDSLLKRYPCIVKEVLNKLEGNQTYGKLVQPFQKIQLPNGTTLGMQGLPNLKYDFSAQDYGVGTTSYSLGTRLRNAMQQTKTLAQDVRNEVTAKKNEK